MTPPTDILSFNGTPETCLRGWVLVLVLVLVQVLVLTLLFRDVDWVLPPLSNSWILVIIWLYLALNRTRNIDCYSGGGAVPNSKP